MNCAHNDSIRTENEFKKSANLAQNKKLIAKSHPLDSKVTFPYSLDLFDLCDFFNPYICENMPENDAGHFVSNRK